LNKILGLVKPLLNLLVFKNTRLRPTLENEIFFNPFMKEGIQQWMPFSFENLLPLRNAELIAEFRKEANVLANI